MRSRRTATVALLSFSSGLPLGLVWIAIPDWMRSIGIDIRVVGLLTLVQAPWTFKFLWSPLMDRYQLPFLGRRRGWAAVAQVALVALGLGLAGVGDHPDTIWVVGALALAIAFASATQDIAIDAYAVDVLREDEQGVAVGARVAVYRAAMFVAGGGAITLAGQLSWPAVNIGLALLYLPMLLVTIKAPEPEESIPAPKSLKEAIWYPFLGFLARHRALEILAFVFFYKFADNLAQALLRPFLVDMGYNDVDRGVALATVGLAATLTGTFIGGALTTLWGLGHCLWLFGFLQIFSNIGYVLVANTGINRPLMYGAMGFETFTQGLGVGAFSVLLLRMTQKRFSVTQYALFSSLFGLPRLFTGPIAGVMVHAAGWTTFFWFTMVAGVPGLFLLSRFVPLGERDPHFVVRSTEGREPLCPTQLASRGMLGGAVAVLASVISVVGLDVLHQLSDQTRVGIDPISPLVDLVRPATLGDWLTLIGIVAMGAITGLVTAAVAAARHGGAHELGFDEENSATPTHD